MKNTLLNEQLFAQLERLNNKDLVREELNQETYNVGGIKNGKSSLHNG